MGLEYLVNLIIDYQLAKFQIYQLSESNFTENDKRDQKSTIMTSFHNIELSKLHIIQAISLPSFIDQGYLDQILGGGGKHPSDLNALKELSPYRVERQISPKVAHKGRDKVKITVIYCIWMVDNERGREWQ